MAGQLSKLARTLQAEPDLAATLRAIVAAAVINIPDSDHAAITLVTTGGKESTPARFQVPRLNGWNGCRN